MRLIPVWESPKCSCGDCLLHDGIMMMPTFGGQPQTPCQVSEDMACIYIRLRHDALEGDCHVAHLSQGACALVLDLIIAQVKLCELVICVLLEGPRQVLCTCRRISNLSTPSTGAALSAMSCTALSWKRKQ